MFTPKRITKIVSVAAALVLPQGLSAAMMEEIIVSAQKREQNIQDVPVAVSALSGSQLNELSITDVFDLQQSVPSLSVRQNQNSTTSNFSIRGVGTSGSNFGLESSVGLYVDGVYRARQNSMINEMIDMEGVEVLRGPQGTLFGRNTPSGAVLMKTVAPSHEGGGYVDLSMGNFGLTSLNGAVGGSVVEDTLAWRLTGFTTQRDGFVDDLNLGDDVINDRDREGGRFQLLYTPNDDLSLRVIADYSQVDEVCCSAITIKNNYTVFNRDDTTGAFSSTPSAGTDTIISIPSFVNIPGTPIPGFGAQVIDESRQDDDLVAFTHLPISSNEDAGFSAELNWNVLGGEFTSISAWRALDSSDYVDGDFNVIDIVSRAEEANQESFTQEFRFALSSERYDLIVGAYYFQQSLDVESSTFLGADANNFVALSVFSQAGTLGEQAALAAQGGNFAAAAALQKAAQYTALSATALVAGIENVALPTDHPLYPLPFFGYSGVGFPDGSSGLNVMEQDHTAWAIFGQLDYKLNDQLTLSAGLRYTEENKDIDGTFTEPGSSWGTLLAIGDLTVVNPRSNIDENIEDEQITGALKLIWQPNDEHMFYASYATGYKAGGTNTDRIHASFSPLFEAENSESFEVGMKADFPDQNLRVNVAVHHTTTEDYQTNAWKGFGFNLTNAGKVVAKGAELELWWQPTDGLRITGAYVFNEAEFKGFETANCWIAYSRLTGIQDPGRANATDNFCDRSGDPLDTNAENTLLLGITQHFAINDQMDAYIHGDYNYRDEQYMDGNIDPFKLQEGYGVANVRLGLHVLAYDAEVALWSRNVLDEDAFNVFFDVPLQSGKLNAYSTEPRTYGLDVTWRF